MYFDLQISVRLYEQIIFVSSLNPSFLFLCLVHAGSGLSAGRRFSEQVVRVCVTLALSEENSCRVREETLLFFPSGRFACDGQRSGFGLGCDVGCSLWARTQRGVEARAVSGRAPLSLNSEVTRDGDPSDPAVRASGEKTWSLTSEPPFCIILTVFFQLGIHFQCLSSCSPPVNDTRHTF